MWRLFATIGLVLGCLMCSVPDADALPKNFRSVDEFYVGAMPKVTDLADLKALGVTTIISLQRLPEVTRKEAEKLGMTLYCFPIRTRLLYIDQIMNVMRNADSHTVYIHCQHGADRTGAVVAYWLVTERHIEPFRALSMVVSPKNIHANGLRELAREYDMDLTDLHDFGIYSGAKNGGLEGLKICGNEWYTRLARNFLLATIGKPVKARNEKFWNKYNHKK